MPGLFVVDLLGKTIADDEVAILKHPNAGALILFTRNFENPGQLRQLIADVRAINPTLFIAVDHEGGIVQRFQRHGFRALPAARVFGEMYDIDKEAGMKLAEKYGEIMARDLLAYGIDLSLAPVVDLHGVSNIIGKLDRAFHDTPEGVVALTSAFIRGMNKAGMCSVGKHYPNHGPISADSHVTKPVYEGTHDDLMNIYVKPFVDLMAQDKLDAIMPAHVTYPSVDPIHAAGFSEIWLKKKLREESHFNGMVMSDCLGMTGADIGDMQTRVNQALNAGCDMLIVCNQTRELLLQVLQSTEIEQSIESYQRIVAFKNKMPLFAAQGEVKIAPYITQTLHHHAEQKNHESSHDDSSFKNDNSALNTTTSI